MFEGKEPDPNASLNQARIIIADYAKELSGAQDHTITSGMQNQEARYWRLPIVGVVKINTDSTFNELTCVGFAGILARNHTGEVIAGLTRRNFAPDIIAEALDLFTGTELFWKMTHLNSSEHVGEKFRRVRFNTS